MVLWMQRSLLPLNSDLTIAIVVLFAHWANDELSMIGLSKVRCTGQDLAI